MYHRYYCSTYSKENQPRPIYLGSEVYSEIAKPNFGNSKTLVNDIPRQDVRWLFAVYHRWSAVDLDWKNRILGFYDSREYRAGSRRDNICEVTHPRLVSLPQKLT